MSDLVQRLRITHFRDNNELIMIAQRAEAADEIDRLTRLRKEDARLYIKAISALCDLRSEIEHEIEQLTERLDAAEGLLQEACDGITLKQTIGFTHIKVSDAWTRRAEEACGG